MKAKLEYTKLDGTRNTVEFFSLEKLEAALAKTKAANPGHDMQEVVSVQKVTGTRTEFYVAYYCDGTWQPVPGLLPCVNRGDLKFELQDCRQNYGKCRIEKTTATVTAWEKLQTA